ncbi:MAG: alpha/beta hydrolase [Bacillota bacterium]|nr:alpha/beta hydrolase [Bacillota bacterium]
MRIAEIGLTVNVIDQRGHGENNNPLDDRVLEEIESATQFCRQYGKVVAVGHSSGGRFAMSSSADFSIGISPALASDYGGRTRELLDNLRSYRVKELYRGINHQIIKNLPEWKYNEQNPTMILYGSRDVPEIVDKCKNIKCDVVDIFEIKNALHNDIYLLEDTFTKVTEQLKKWFFICKNEQL